MDDTLKRLLDAEMEAERRVQEAKQKREEITRKALEEARRAEQRFEERRSDIGGAFLEKAESRARQSIAELQRRYDEHNRELREMAEVNEEAAVEAALGVLLDPERL